jgi:MFS family permease
VFLLFFISTWTGRLTDAGYFKQIIILGTVLQILGLFMTSLSTQYWQLFVAQGVCLGLGNGCLFCPTISLVSTYFFKKRSLAIGVVACGSATGGLVFPAMVQQLLPKVGFGWTLRALGFVQLACLVICIIFAKQRLPPRRAGPIVEWAAFKELPYTLFTAGIFFVSITVLTKILLLTFFPDLLGRLFCVLLRKYYNP